MPTCPACGRENGDGARFCSECGAALAEAGSREVRKTVTVLFWDVSGSTALGERLEPEPCPGDAPLLRRGGSNRAPLGHRGEVHRRRVTAAFGARRPRRRCPARRPCRRRSRRRAQPPERGARAFVRRLAAVRIGVNTGEVVAGQGATRHRRRGERRGTARAGRRAGRNPVGEQTHSARPRSGRGRGRPRSSLKGKDEPFYGLPAAGLIEGAPLRAGSRARSSAAQELAGAPAFDRAVSARAAAGHLLGAPGIGKSRLALELSAVVAGEATVSGPVPAVRRGHHLSGRSSSLSRGGRGGRARVALRSRARGDFWSVLRRSSGARANSRLPSWSRTCTGGSRCSSTSSSTSRLEPRRAGPGALPRSAGVPRQSRRPGAGSSALEPLTELESVELIANLLGSSVGVDERGRPRAHSGRPRQGNPLFVEQLLAMLTDGGDPDHVPPTIHALLEARLDALPEAERHVLSVPPSSATTSSGTLWASCRPTGEGRPASAWPRSCAKS